MLFNEMLCRVGSELREYFNTPNAIYTDTTSIYKLDPKCDDLDEIDLMELSMHLDDVFGVDSENFCEDWSNIGDIVCTYLRLYNKKPNEVKPVSKNVVTEVIRRVWTTNEREFIEVAPSGDFPDFITLRHLNGYWGNFEFTLDAPFAVQFAKAILAAAEEAGATV